MGFRHKKNNFEKACAIEFMRAIVEGFANERNLVVNPEGEECGGCSGYFDRKKKIFSWKKFLCYSRGLR